MSITLQLLPIPGYNCFFSSKMKTWAIYQNRIVRYHSVWKRGRSHSSNWASMLVHPLTCLYRLPVPYTVFTAGKSRITILMPILAFLRYRYPFLCLFGGKLGLYTVPVLVPFFLVFQGQYGKNLLSFYKGTAGLFCDTGIGNQLKIQWLCPIN